MWLRRQDPVQGNAAISATVPIYGTPLIWIEAMVKFHYPHQYTAASQTEETHRMHAGDGRTEIEGVQVHDTDR